MKISFVGKHFWSLNVVSIYSKYSISRGDNLPSSTSHMDFCSWDSLFSVLSLSWSSSLYWMPRFFIWQQASSWNRQKHKYSQRRKYMYTKAAAICTSMGKAWTIMTLDFYHTCDTLFHTNQKICPLKVGNFEKSIQKRCIFDSSKLVKEFTFYGNMPLILKEICGSKWGFSH